MKVKIDNRNIHLKSEDSAVEFDVTMALDMVWDALYAIKEFFRYTAPGRYKTPMRSRTRQESDTERVIH